MERIYSVQQHSIQIVLNASAVRMWQKSLIQRLKSAGYAVGVQLISSKPQTPHPMDAILGLEQRRFGSSLAALCPAPAEELLADPDVIVDLAGSATENTAPVLRLRFNGHFSLADGVAALLAANATPIIGAVLDGVGIGIARPMLSDRLWLSRMFDELLAGAISLIEQCMAKFAHGTLTPIDLPPKAGEASSWRPYLTSFGAQLLHRAVGKLRNARPFYWQVAYRRRNNQQLGHRSVGNGAPFTILPDDGQRFYADPFVLEHAGRTYLFVEEYPYALNKGVIAAAELGKDDSFGTPRTVLEEPHHLSYPQVFKRGDDIFMLPESGGARRLVLYRAAAFPDQWVGEAVLLEDVDINDATLLDHDGLLWLFGTERRGPGSASDTLVVYFAQDLRGPWKPHKLNPIAIDSAAARPGGAFLRNKGRIFLPVQDGRKLYGGGLGLMELLQLDEDNVVFASPLPIDPAPAWNRSGIHTFNQAGGFEVVDSCG
jgi:hypothetical protein